MSLPAESLPRLAKYDLVEEIGHGGMATVYRARDRRLGREIAVKLIHRHLRENVEIAKRFNDEARAVAKLKHPNIVEIYDVSEDDGPERYLTAELVRGKSLRSVLAERRSLPAEIAATVVVELCAALGHAHERGVVHRDVKPENVLFGLPEQGGGEGDPSVATVKLTDFGIAKMLDQQGVTATGQVLGTPAYMAPEQFEGGVIDARSDVFSLGVLLYECIVGHPPFEGKNPAQVLRRVLDGTYAPVDRECPEAGATWAQLVARAIAQQPEERFASMVEMRAELERELEALGASDRKQELTSFFADPEGYSSRLPSRLVPRLLARGEAARKARNPVDAAAHLNRALALAPTDPQVIAAVAALTRSRSLEALRLRAMQAAGALALAVFAALGTARLVRGRNSPPPRAEGFEPGAWVHGLPDRLALGPAASSSSVVPAGSTSGPPGPSASGSAGHRLASPVAGPHPAVEGGKRVVNFIVFPKSARFSLDGVAIAQDDAEALSRELPVGSSHTLRVWLDAGNTCCQRSEDAKGFTVLAPDESGKPQYVELRLPLNDATLVSKGPPGFQITCPGLRVPMVPASSSYAVPMRDVRADGKCFLYDGPTRIAEQTVRLLPGQPTPITWPGFP